MSDNLQEVVIQTLENHHQRLTRLEQTLENPHQRLTEQTPVRAHWLRRMTTCLIRVAIFGYTAASLAPHAEHWALKAVTIILAIGAVLNTSAALDILEGRRG